MFRPNFPFLVAQIEASRSFFTCDCQALQAVPKEHCDFLVRDGENSRRGSLSSSSETSESIESSGVSSQIRGRAFSWGCMLGDMFCYRAEKKRQPSKSLLSLDSFDFTGSG